MSPEGSATYALACGAVKRRLNLRHRSSAVCKHDRHATVVNAGTHCHDVASVPQLADSTGGTIPQLIDTNVTKVP